MEKNYFTNITDEHQIFWFEENGQRISFGETPGNRHYEEYLEWVAKGNTPEVIEG